MDKSKIVNDERSDKTIETAANVNTYPQEHIGKEMLEKIAYHLAKRLYVVTGNDLALREHGLTYDEISKIKRPRGRPKKTLYTDRDIVQLIYKQELQAGIRFTNVAGKENNECFIAVAEHQNVGVDQIVRQYKNVPAKERKKIKEWLRQKLAEHDLLDKNRE